MKLRSFSFPRVAAACLLVLSMAFITSCQNLNDDVLPTAESVTEADITQAMNQVAPAVAEMLNEGEVRKLIKELSLLEFDGDYNVLYKDIASKPLASGETFGQRLTSSLATRLGSEEQAMATIKMIPRFHIAVPVNIEQWE
ncbi:MAG: hypothetical protein AAFQ68_23670, partial [Bacteroidota bacterium]